MNRVNPPPLRVPAGLAKDMETRRYLDQLHMTIYQLWQRTGGGDDAVSGGGETTVITIEKDKTSPFLLMGG